jgi:hypothetical protein
VPGQSNHRPWAHIDTSNYPIAFQGIQLYQRDVIAHSRKHSFSVPIPALSLYFWFRLGSSPSSDHQLDSASPNSSPQPLPTLLLVFQVALTFLIFRFWILAQLLEGS